MLELWLVLSLACIFLYAVSQVGNKLALGGIQAPTMILVTFIVALPVSILFIALYLVTGEIWNVSPEHFFYGVLAAIFGQAGYYLYLIAVEKGPISVVGSITAAYPAMVVVVAILFLGEVLTLLQSLGITLIIAGMISLSYVHGDSDGPVSTSRECFMMCILATLLWGLWGIFTKLALDGITPLLFLGIYAFVNPPITWAYFRLKRLKIRAIFPKWIVPVMIAVMSVEIGNIAFYSETYAISMGPASIVFPLVASYPVLVVLMAFAFLRERLSRKEVLLISAVLIGIIMVSTV